MSSVSEDGFVDEEQERAAGEVRKGYSFFERGDILVAKITPCFENGKATRTSSLRHPVGFGSTEFHVLRASNEVLPDYVFHTVWNSSFREVGAKNMTGSAGQKRVPTDFIRRLEIPLPPLDEQRRIAAILDKADALRRNRKRTLELLDGLTQSIFLEMFGDPFELQDVISHGSEKRVPLSEVTSRITYGFTQPMSHHDTGIPILTAKNVRMGSLDIENVHFASEEEFEQLSAKSKPDPGDLLVTKDGTIGRAALFDNSMPVCINQSIALVKPNRALISPVYLLYYILSGPVQLRIEGMKKGNAMPHLQITEFARFPIAMAPMDKQQQFERRVAAAASQRSRNQRSLTELDAAFSSLQHRAFAGQL